MYSMTGYGRGVSQEGERRLQIELKSVNHKNLDINIYGLRSFPEKDLLTRNFIRENFARGSFDVKVTYEGGEGTLFFDEKLFLRHHEIFKEGTNLLGREDVAPISYLLNQKNVIGEGEEEGFSEEFFLAALKEARDNLLIMRSEEGKALEADLGEKIMALQRELEEIEKLHESSLDREKKRKKENIQALLSEYSLDPQRLATEMALLIDKMDIDEEITRLHSHIEQFHVIMKDTNPIGRKLDFLLQEMNREANTISSKARDIAILHLIVEAKSLIERMREQVQNIE